jgi:hypothetical protein
VAWSVRASRQREQKFPLGLDLKPLERRQETCVSEIFWAQVAECFNTDDGSLPGIEIGKLSAEGVAAIYAMLRRRSRLAGELPVFWSRTEEASLLVDSVSNAATLVASGQAEAFHHCIAGVIAAGVELPILGVFVWRDIVELDYRMGTEWRPPQVVGFFELLRDCCAIDAGAVVAPAEFEGPPNPERFAQAWAHYNESEGAAIDCGGV